MKRLARYFHYLLGSYIRSQNSPVSLHDPDSMIAGLERAKKWITQPATIIDVGAASGQWTRSALSVWPNANCVLFEPLIEQEENLNKLKINFNFNKINVFYKLVGESISTVPFNITDDLDGSGIYGVDHPAKPRVIEMIDIDTAVTSIDCKGDFIIKLDTHGYELPILKGAENTLKSTKLLIIEAYGFYVSPTSILFWDLCKFLDGLGFRLIDLVDIMRRSKDDAFWQCDLFFIRKEEVAFLDNKFN